MLTIELRVNGALIGHAQLINQGYLKGLDDTCEYEYHAWLTEGKGNILRGRLKHKRSDGAFELVRKLTEDMNKKKQKGAT